MKVDTITMMRTLLILLVLFLMLPAVSWSENGYIEITAPGNRQLRMAVDVPRSLEAASSPEKAREMGEVIAFDMNMSGLCLAEIKEQFNLSGALLFAEADFNSWLKGGYDLLVRGEYSVKGDDLTVEFRLFDLANRKMMTARRYLGKTKDLRRFAHSFADEILLAMTGERGCFTTHIAFVSTRSGNKEIAIMDWDGHDTRQLTRNHSINLNPDFSPNGREIIFTSYKRHNPDLYRRPLSSPVEVAVSHREGLNITGAWSPDGSRIALALSKDGNSEIYTIARDGSSPVRLTSHPAIEISPTWSPNGSQIAFVSDRLGKPQIFIMNADGTGVRRLTTNGGYNVNPRWSPKGDKIAYARMEGGGFQIHTINVNGSDDTQLTSSGSSENPAWSPDGRLIAFSGRRGSGDEIYVMRADGSGETRVSKVGGRSTQPAWQPR
ncbi:WD-40 repeat-containing protein [Pelobacter propionicus DSM 2379]|uniref:WD-40 repeat-containing protein n=2 Tax=Pelobacter propionicus TaxID=29543 RepID=A1AU95_PELPD|nr:WD-40 repeat-containing protein [Pelobacter propionicus DSM 2379]